jgi:hypothetical protein
MRGINLYINGMATINFCGTAQERLLQPEPDYKLYIPDAGVRRRMSRIIRMGISSALMALDSSGDNKTDAIVTGTGWGCLADTEKFLISILDNNERMLNPASFIQSTSNTIGAQIALMLSDNHYNNTFVHGGSSFEAAIIDASMLAMEGRERILTGGFDELTPTKENLLNRMGIWRKHIRGEGSTFFVLSPLKGARSRGKIVALDLMGKDVSDNEIIKRGKELLESRGLSFSSLRAVLCGRDSLCGYFQDMKIDTEYYKLSCGEYPTSAAYGLWRGVDLLSNADSGDYVLIINSYLGEASSLMLIEK